MILSSEPVSKLVRQAWIELSLLIKLQGRPCIIEMTGAFLHEGDDGTFLVIEMPFYGNGRNILHWMKGRHQLGNDGGALRLETYGSQHGENQILKPLLKLVECVADLHNVRIEHRGLNPDHILVDEHDLPRLIGFGLSEDESLSFASTPESALPMRTTSSLSKLYTPPERRTNCHTATEFGKWDVYSMGVILFQCLCSSDDWKTIEELSESDDAASRLFSKESGLVRGWIQELIIRMLNREARARPTMHQVASEVKEYLTDRLTELDHKLRPKMHNAATEFIQIIQGAQKKRARGLYWENIQVNLLRTRTVKDLIDAFALILKRDDLLSTIDFHFLGETGLGVGVFREVCEIFCSECFSTKPTLFTKHESFDFFSPSDWVETQTDMESVGKFLFHCMARNTTLKLRFSPLVFCCMVKSVPQTQSAWLNLFRRIDSRRSVAMINDYLHDSEKSNREMAKEQLEIKIQALCGTRHRMNNIKHLCRGFTSCMTEQEKDKLELVSWEDMSMLCCGPEVIDFDTLWKLLRESLAYVKWHESKRARQTKRWFVNWLKQQDNEGLRLFLRFVTANSTLPFQLKGWKICVFPCSEGISSQTCSKEMRIGVDRPDEESFCEMMQFAMENQDTLKDD